MDAEYEKWDEDARYLYDERIAISVGAMNPVPEEVDDMARTQVRAHLLTERKRNRKVVHNAAASCNGNSKRL